MIPTTNPFDLASTVSPAKRIYRFTIEDYSRAFVYRPTGIVNDYAWITSINDWSVSVDPLNGSYTIDDLVVGVVDKGAAITGDLGLLLLEGRRCKLQLGFAGLAIDDYVTLFSGIVGSVTPNGDNTYSFTCNDYNRLNQRIIYLQGDAGTTVTTTTTYNPNFPFTIVTDVQNIQSSGQVIRSAYVNYSNIGPSGPVGTTTVTAGGVTTTTTVTSRVVTVGHSNTTVYESVVVVTTTNSITTTNTTYGSALLYTNVAITSTVDVTTGINTTAVAITFTENGPVGTVTQSDLSMISSSNPRRLIGHPLNILLDILQVEIGFADSDINLDLISAYRDSVFTGIEFDFTLTNSVDAKDFIENQLLKPLAGYQYTNSIGQLCIGFAQPLPGGLVAQGAITPSNITELPNLTAADLTNVVTVRFDKDDAGVGTSSTGYLAEANTFFAPTISDLTDLTGQVIQESVTGGNAVQGQYIIQSDGMRSGFQGFLLAKMISNSIFSMYGNYNPALEATVFWNPFFRVELAEFVTLSHPLLPNRRAGVMGIVNQMFRVKRRSYNFTEGLVTFSLEDASGIKAFGAHRIAPTGKVAYTAATSADHDRYIFMSDASGNQTNGDKAANLG